MTDAADAAEALASAADIEGASKLPIGTVEGILEKAPRDLVEEVIEIPEWGCSVKVKSLTQAKTTAIKQAGIKLTPDGPQVNWAEMEIKQFQQGVVEPRFNEGSVRKLHASSGRGFARVTAWLDKHAGTNRKELEQALKEFPVPEE